MRAEVIDRVVDPVILILKDCLKSIYCKRPGSGDVARLLYLGNADDQVVSTGGAGDRFEFVPQGYYGSDGLLLGNQVGKDVIVDLAQRDQKLRNR